MLDPAFSRSSRQQISSPQKKIKIILSAEYRIPIDPFVLHSGSLMTFKRGVDLLVLPDSSLTEYHKLRIL